MTVEYRIDFRNREAFLDVLERLAHERRRDGAYGWGVFEDTAEEGRFLETFLVESWLEHLRQHERVTNADRVLQDAVHRFHREGTPKVTHFISAAQARHTPKRKGEELMNNQSSPETPRKPVAVLPLRTVKPGFEERFEAELHD